MKTKFISLLLLILFIVSCSDDDVNVIEEPEVPISVVLNEVKYQDGDWIEIFNNGDSTADLSDYWLCLGPGAYTRIGNITPLNGSITNLQPGGYLVVPFTLPDDNAGLGLYSSNSFTSTDAIVDFVQYGAAGSARESVAVAASLWTAGDFIPTVGSANNSIVFDGEGNGVSNWAESTTVTAGAENVLTVPVRSIVINEVQFGNRDLVELYNNGEIAVDLAPYWLCLGPGEYNQIGDLTPESGNIILEPGAFLVVPFSMDDSEGLGLYSSNSFTSADAIIDFVQFGAAGSARENVAVSAGIWTANEYVSPVRLNSYSIEYDGDGDAASDWTEEVNPSLGYPNDTEVQKTTFDVTITNVTNYLNVHPFTTPVGASSPGPLTTNGAQYQISFKAVPGTKFTPVTMMANSNDWFLAPTNLAGIDLFPGGQALNGVDIANQLSLYDLGTETDGDVATFPPAGVNVGPADSNTNVRLVEGRDKGDIYLTAVLDYANGDGNSAGTFTLTITAINTPDPNLAASQDNGFVVTPGIVVLHALPEPLFTLGESDRGVGLERIAEDGMPGELYNWFAEVGTGGAPLRLSSSLSVFSPGLVYAFNTDKDPLVKQGETAKAGNGLEELAEDGNNSVAVSYINDLGLPAVASNETAPIGPGGQLTFAIEVPQGQNYKLGFSTMLVQTNDWFLSYNNSGFDLFDENGTPASGTEASIRTYLYDAGTEADEAVGLGTYQAPRQTGPNEGPIDANTTVRRVNELEDVQFGKGIIQSAPGVVYLQDPRGGYNVFKIEVQPQ